MQVRVQCGVTLHTGLSTEHLKSSYLRCIEMQWYGNIRFRKTIQN
jgi:hypothetical protein